jgi:hypothetical protein
VASRRAFSRSAMATMLASVPPSGRSRYLSTSSRIRTPSSVVSGSTRSDPSRKAPGVRRVPGRRCAAFANAEGKPWRPYVCTNRFGRLRPKLDLEHVRLHDLRPFVASVLIDGGRPRGAPSPLPTSLPVGRRHEPNAPLTCSASFSGGPSNRDPQPISPWCSRVARGRRRDGKLSHLLGIWHRCRPGRRPRNRVDSVRL